ncbi:acetyl-CoA C-acetyltransferase [Halalkalibacter akibai]|uniref:acetyl-CoA C-acetyltransferase n=1 Tax=Halalkalibacter akibai (strain ATCC 43226 / DSM 21942 / CIP 109018 / JCM 9157 / 1139) TaxID=1236973 RepID=W4QQI4_HALA3|nr:acetyl-CoA C-acetyltransferase [Halalkalibacter akibai]GAE33599.1 3-ketoacyl-CoA thiolase [Halalkalibacter akibai JCM 9157]
MRTVIVSGARTPFAKFGGVLKSVSAQELGGFAIKETLKRANWPVEKVDEVILGNVLQAGQGQIPSRQAAHSANLPWEIKTETINKVCASGMRSVTLADQAIRLQEADVIIAGGMESMSNAPYYLPNARWGERMGNGKMIDGLVHDGLTCSFRGVHMGTYGSDVARELEISREQQDQWAFESHQKAIAAIESGKLAEEIVSVPVQQRKGDPIIVSADEAPRKDTSLESLAKLKPVFSKDGTITAGNAPGVNDGAATLLLMSEEKAKEAGIAPLATIVAHTALATKPEDFPKTPGLVINQLLEKTGLTVGEVDLFEINEAFAAVALASQQLAGLSPEKINVNGGAVALGHPIGASGARIILTLAYELKRRGGGLGIAAICSGGGQGDAVLIEV